ncbi:MAG: metal ABC transporter permease [Chloroflexi bacterium]|nr:metal ABC transporter permease [Chloroflexota bacterium]
MEAAILVGLVSGVVGSLVVVRGMSFFADALAHTILPGVAYMYQRSRDGDVPDFAEENPLFWGGLMAGIVSALLIGVLTRNARLRNDTAFGVDFVGMFALGIAMVSRVESYAGDLTHILFGQILGVSDSLLRLTLIFSLIVLGLVVLFYKEFLTVSFDPVLSRTLGLPTEFFRFLLLILMALTIVVSLQIVGIALMLALLITPAATASLMTHRLHWMMLLSGIIGMASSIIGFYLSYHIDVSTGPAIVLVATALFFFVFIEQALSRYAVLLARRIGEFFPLVRQRMPVASE